MSVCAVCKKAPGPVCPVCADDWGQIVLTIERWQRAELSARRLQKRIEVLVVYLCDSRGLSEIQAAKLVGVSRPTIRAWRGK
jgi:hypothetical protein